MTPHPFPADQLCNLSAELASVLALFATDHPLVQVCGASSGPSLVWHYIELVVEVFVIQGSSGRLLGQKLGGVAVEVGTIDDAMTLLRLTEGRIQETEWPYVRLA